LPAIRVELDRHRVDGRSTFFRHVGEGLLRRLQAQQKINEHDVVVPDNAYQEATKAYYLLSDTYKALAGIEWTDDVKKAGISMAAVMVVSPYQAPDTLRVSNRYVPHINGLFAEASACTITENEEFFSRHFESKLHFYTSLLLLARFDCLSTFVDDLKSGSVRNFYEIEFSVLDHARISDAIQTAEMISNFKVTARPAGTAIEEPAEGPVDHRSLQR
jgi:hypothetical protein